MNWSRTFSLQDRGSIVVSIQQYVQKRNRNTIQATYSNSVVSVYYRSMCRYPVYPLTAKSADSGMIPSKVLYRAGPSMVPVWGYEWGKHCRPFPVEPIRTPECEGGHGYLLRVSIRGHFSPDIYIHTSYVCALFSIAFAADSIFVAGFRQFCES